MRFCTALILPIAMALAWNEALAQAWPSKPVRVVVPFAPGGTADTLGASSRPSSAKPSRRLSSSRTAAARAAWSARSSSPRRRPTAIRWLCRGRLALHRAGPVEGFPLRSLRDFTHIALFGGPPGVLVIYPGLPAKDLKQFIAYAKSENGKLAYGSPGNGTQDT